MLARTSSRISGVATSSSIVRPRASACVYPKSRSAPGFHPDDRAVEIHGDDGHRARLDERVRVLLLALDLPEEPGVVDGQHRLGREGLERGDDLRREGAPLAPHDDQAAEQPVLADERDGEERAHALPGEEPPHLGGDELALSSSMSATWTGSRVTPARPIAPSPSRIGAARTASRSSAVIWCVARAWKLWVGLVELVDDSLVAAGELDRAADDGREHGLEVERGADGLADLAERLELADRSREVPRPRLQLVNSRTFSMAMTAWSAKVSSSAI